MKRSITQEQLNEVVRGLQGQCVDSLDSMLHNVLENDDLDADILTMDELAYIDEETYRCPRCDWWNHEGISGTVEYCGEPICYECIEELGIEEEE